MFARSAPLESAFQLLPASSKSAYANRFGSMARTSSSILIDAPIEKIMGIIGDVENYPKWTSGITDVQILEQDDLGRPIRTKFKISGGPISDLVELSYNWSADQVDWHLISGSSITSLNGTYKVKELAGQSEVTYELDAEISVPLPSFIKSAGEKTIVTTALQGLKDYAS